MAVELRVGLVQLDAGEDVAANVAGAVDRADRAAAAGAHLVALPESFHQRGSASGYRASAGTIPGVLTDPFAAVARRHGAWLLLGSIAERSTDPERPYNTSVLLAPDGSVAATYRKVHLFDVDVDSATVDRESDRVLPGTTAVVADLGPVSATPPDTAGTAGDGAGARRDPAGRIAASCPDPRLGEQDAPLRRIRLGLSICYDLRFPELYRTLALAGAEVFCVPANFTERTGRDHWEVLLRARAIENGTYVIAPAQCGRPPVGPAAYGHSLVVDPWGLVVARASDGPGILLADLDLDRVADARRRIPTLANRRPGAYRLDGA